jgi:hypothetical protein
MPEFVLQPHPSTPCTWIDALTVRVDWLTADLLVLYYRIQGDIDRLQLPPQRRSAPADGLWKSTCLEAFLKPAAGAEPARYFECNFSPSSEWALYAFDAYRAGMRLLEPAQPPKILFRRRTGELDADVDVHLSAFALPPNTELEVGLCAVLQDVSGAACYWALAHAEGKPDFHRASAFAARLTPPKESG